IQKEQSLFILSSNQQPAAVGTVGESPASGGDRLLARCDVAYVDMQLALPVPRSRGESLSVRPGNAGTKGLVGDLDLLLTASGPIGTESDSIGRAIRTCQPCPVGAESQTLDDAGVMEGYTRLTRRGVPQSDVVIPTAGSDPAAVWADGYRVDGPG